MNRLSVDPGAAGRRAAALGACLVLCLASSDNLIAQTAGVVRGTVTDSSGAPLPGVGIVVVSRTMSGPRRSAVSDRMGAFQVLSLPPGGDYRVEAAAPGFAKAALTDVEVLSGRTVLVNIVLNPEQEIRERIEVKARAPVVELERTLTETRFDSEAIEGLPLIGRNYEDVLTLAPGVSDVDGDGNPNIHGSRDTDMATLLDGIASTDPYTGQAGVRLNIESIQEIALVTTGAPAEFGRAQGGFTSVVTKSGGNEFTGSFKFFWRGSALDGDGAGADDPRLHLGVGEDALRSLSFDDFMPFLAISGPIVKDRAWFYAALEHIQEERPVNALNLAFVDGHEELRAFAKTTWQASPSHRIALSINHDPQTDTNQGLNSFTRPESGYTLHHGGTLVSLRSTALLGPLSALESSLGFSETSPDLVPNLDRDSNRNGVLYFDRNGNGSREANERDPGEDYDRDGVFDVFEDTDGDGILDPREDRDGDGNVTPPFGCEGVLREDLDCDGHLDNVNEDTNGDGQVDTLHEDIDGDRRLDSGLEDRNGNSLLDDSVRPADLYPYGHLTPEAPDRDYTLGETTGIISGPYYQEFTDRRGRVSLREDLSVFAPDFRGSHDLKLGLTFEREIFNRLARAGDIISRIDSEEDCLNTLQEVVGDSREGGDGVLFCSGPTDQPTVKAILHAQPEVASEANSFAGGIYAQDIYKPLPNLSLGLGVRFDREQTDSSGYSQFDPAMERAPFDRVWALAGGEMGAPDLILGNGDGLMSQGVRGDPIFFGQSGDSPLLLALLDGLQAGTLSRMTRHHSEHAFWSAQAESIFGNLIDQGGQLDLQRLQSLGVLPQFPEQFRLTNNNLSPRLAISFDPAGRGRLKLFGTWGRYYDRLFLSTITPEVGPDRLHRYYLYAPTGVTVSTGFYGQAVRGVPNHYIGRLISKAPPSTTQVDRSLQTPFSDELTLGFEVEVRPEMALSLTYIGRHYQDQLQDVDLNHTLRYDPEGRPLDVLGILYYLGGGNELQPRRFPDGRPDLFINNFFFNQVLRIGNFNEARYRGIELRLTRRQSRHWQMSGSYTYSRAVGDGEDFQSRLGNDPSVVESEYGYLDYDQRHVVKVNGLTWLPRDWQVGFAFEWGSGLPYSVVSRFFALDNIDLQQFRTRYGFTEIAPNGSPSFHPLKRNSERNAATYNIDLSVRKHFVIGRSAAAFSLEVENLLNTDDLQIFTYEPNPSGLSVANRAQLGGLLPVDGVRRFGRRVQVGFQFEF